MSKEEKIQARLDGSKPTRAMPSLGGEAVYVGAYDNPIVRGTFVGYCKLIENCDGLGLIATTCGSHVIIVDNEGVYWVGQVNYTRLKKDCQPLSSSKA